MTFEHDPDNHITLGSTSLFRRDTAHVIGGFASTAAPQLARGGAELVIADVGCSTGEQTWSLASVLHQVGVRFRIEAFDNDQSRLSRATQPYPIAAGRLALTLENRESYPDSCIGDFEDIGGTHVQPGEHLLQAVEFRQLDIVDTPLDEDSYDAAIITNVLYHYAQHPDKFASILDNVTAGLRPGGLLVHDGFLYNTLEPFHSRRLYRSRAAGPSLANMVFRYDPERKISGIKGWLWSLYERELARQSAPC